MAAHLVGQLKLFFACAVVVISSKSSTWFVGVGTQEMEDGASQFSRISLQIIEEIKVKQIWTNIASPSRGDLAGIRARGHIRTLQIPNYFVDISHVKSANISEANPPGQLRPGSFNRITGQKNHL
jgi:hypothetical protein